DRSVRVWDVLFGRELVRCTGHTESVVSVAISPDGKYILSGSKDKSLRLWSATTGEQLVKLDGPAPLLAVAFSPDGKHVAAGFDAADKAKPFRVWDLATKQELSGFSAPGGCAALAFLPDGRRLLAGHLDGSVRLWRLFADDQPLRKPDDADPFADLLAKKLD